MTEWKGFGRREVKEGWSRVRSERTSSGDVYLLAFLGVVVAFAGLLFAWSGLENEPERHGGGWTFAGLALVALGALLCRPLYLQHWGRRPAPAAQPLAPWLADHLWDPSGVGSDADRPRWGDFAWLAGGTLFVSVFLAIPEWPFRAVGGFLGLVVLALWWRPLRFVLHRAKFGTSRLRFVRSPTAWAMR